MCLEIGYDTFEEDCKKIIGNILINKYSFSEVSEKYQNKSDNKHTLFYRKESWLIRVSMVSNFPHIGAGITHCNLNEVFARPSILKKCLGINSKEWVKHMKDFEKENGIDTYEKELKYAILHEEKFYQPILIGQFTFEDYERFARNQSS